jgi:hypothetical protein
VRARRTQTEEDEEGNWKVFQLHDHSLDRITRHKIRNKMSSSRRKNVAGRRMFHKDERIADLRSEQFDKYCGRNVV